MVGCVSPKLREKVGSERDLGITHISVKTRVDIVTQRESESRQSRTEGQGEGSQGRGWEEARGEWGQERLGRSGQGWKEMHWNFP